MIQEGNAVVKLGVGCVPLTMQLSSSLTAACKGGEGGGGSWKEGGQGGEGVGGVTLSAMSRAAKVTNAHLEGATMRTLQGEGGVMSWRIVGGKSNEESTVNPRVHPSQRRNEGTPADLAERVECVAHVLFRHVRPDAAAITSACRKCYSIAVGEAERVNEVDCYNNAVGEGLHVHMPTSAGGVILGRSAARASIW